MKTTTPILAGCFALLLSTPAIAQETDAPDEAAETADVAETESTEASAVASTEAVENEATEEAQAAGKDWGISFRVGNTIGQGTFVNVSNDSGFTDPDCEGPPVEGCVGEANNAFDRANLSYGLSGSYQFGDFSTSASIGLVQWLTAGGGINDAREVRFQDIGLGVGYKGWSIDSIGVNISPSASFTLPTSKLSQISTLILGTSLGVSISKTFFDKLGLSLSIGGGKDFHRFTSPVLDAENLQAEVDEQSLQEELQPEAVIYRAGGSEDLGRGLVALSGVNTEWALSFGLGASIPVYEKLRLSASYGLNTAWTYAFDNEDEFTPDVPNVQTGRGVGQGFGTSVTLSYPITLGDVNLGLSGGIRTGGAPKTSDNRSFRFPFWNFSGAASNASALSFAVSASY